MQNLQNCSNAGLHANFNIVQTADIQCSSSHNANVDLHVTCIIIIGKGWTLFKSISSHNGNGQGQIHDFIGGGGGGGGEVPYTALVQGPQKGPGKSLFFMLFMLSEPYFKHSITKWDKT